MVFLLTDAGEYRELAIPSSLTVGRAPSNNIRPESPSVSKNHAILTLSYIPNTTKVEVWLEDLESRNGTYTGPTLLDIEKVNGKAKIRLGDYVRFGYAQKFFQLLENIPRDAEALPVEIVVSPSKEFQRDAMNLSVEAPALQSKAQTLQNNQLLPPNFNDSRDFSRGSYNDQEALILRDSPGGRSRGSYTSQSTRQDRSVAHYGQRVDRDFDYAGKEDGEEDTGPRNMRISVDYPTTGGSLQHPVSITIDPPNHQRQPSRSNRHGLSGSKGIVSPVAEELDELSSPAHGKDYPANRGGYYPAGSGSKSDGNRWLDSMQYDGTANDRVRFRDSGTGNYNYGTGTDGLGGTDRTNVAPALGGLNFTTESLDELPRIDRSRSLDPNKSKATESSQRRNRSPTKVIDAIDQLDALSRRSSDMKQVAQRRSRGSNRYNSDYKDRPEKDIDPSSERALYSSYYLDKPRGILKSSAAGIGGSSSSGHMLQPPPVYSSGAYTSDPMVDSAEFDQLLATELMRHNNSQQIQPPAAPDVEQKRGITLVRRSWPEELRAPSAEMIARYVDLLLANEAGTTQREYELYKEIQEGRHNKKRKSESSGSSSSPADEFPLETAGSLAELQLNPVKCTIPTIIPAEVMTEAVAETLQEAGSGNKSAIECIGMSIRGLNDLLRQCLRGAGIDSSGTFGGDPSTAEFDHALQGVLSSIIHQSIQHIRDATDCGVVRALERCNESDVSISRRNTTASTAAAGSDALKTADAPGNKSRKLTHKTDDELSSNIGLLLQQSIDTLTRINSFLLGNYLAEQSLHLKVEQVYEIASLALSAVLNKLDACIVAVGSINHRVDEVAMEHVMAQGGGFHKTSLSLELEELRRLKRETELTPLVERIRQQEAAILEKKLLRFHRVFELLLGYQLRSSLLKWRMIVRALKQHEMGLHDLVDRSGLSVKRSMFKEWHRLWKEKSKFRKVMNRLARVAGSKGETVMRRYFQRWSKRKQEAAMGQHSAAEVAQLRLELCNIKAAIHDLTNTDEVAASLAAERALNRELSAVNLELRQSLQRMEHKLLECAAVPAAKRRDLVNTFLLQKEEELAAVHRENQYLHNEVDQKLREVELIQTKRAIVEKKESDIGFPATAAATGRRGAQNNISSRQRGGQYLPQRKTAAQPAAAASRNGRSTRAMSFGMSKDMALDVILFEVKRLRTSFSEMQRSKALLSEKVATETHRNVQLTMAVQSLESRITAMERSATALRELLRQRLGDQGVLHLITALENLGAGSNVLLDMPSSSSASFVAEGSNKNNTSAIEDSDEDIEADDLRFRDHGIHRGDAGALTVPPSAASGMGRSAQSREQRSRSDRDRTEESARSKKASSETKAFDSAGSSSGAGYKNAIDDAIYR